MKEKPLGHTRDTSQFDLDEQRVEQMLKLAKTRAELQDLVRMLDNRNMQLQRVIRALTTKETN